MHQKRFAFLSKLQNFFNTETRTRSDCNIFKIFLSNKINEIFNYQYFLSLPHLLNTADLCHSISIKIILCVFLHVSLAKSFNRSRQLIVKKKTKCLNKKQKNHYTWELQHVL